MHSAITVGPMATHIVLLWTHRLFANLKRWGLGVYHGLRRTNLQHYLDEFVFRSNRRRTRHAAFNTLLGIGARTSGKTIEPKTGIKRCDNESTKRLSAVRTGGSQEAGRRSRGVEFAPDSPLEGDGFEPSVPRQKDNAFRDSSFPNMRTRHRRLRKTLAAPSSSCFFQL
jgi:hypothetical protein